MARNEGALESGPTLNPELQLDRVPADVGGFEYGLQVGLPYPRVHGLEVFKERLDQARYPVPDLCPVLLFIYPQRER